VKEDRRDMVVVSSMIKMSKMEEIIPARITDRIERMPHALTVRELKELLQVSDQTIYRMIADKTIPFLIVRNSYRFDPKQIAEWLRQRSMSA